MIAYLCYNGYNVMVRHGYGDSQMKSAENDKLRMAETLVAYVSVPIMSSRANSDPFVVVFVQNNLDSNGVFTVLNSMSPSDVESEIKELANEIDKFGNYERGVSSYVNGLSERQFTKKFGGKYATGRIDQY